MSKVLITAGCTTVPIDQVRVISNIFKGRTGTSIAEYFSRHHEVTLVTSNPALTAGDRKFKVIAYRTFDDLAAVMEDEIVTRKYDTIIHSAAVSDYRVAGIFSKNPDGSLVPVDANNKVSSSHDELFMRFTPTEKLIDKIRPAWGFRGQLVKFKLEVGISDEKLLEIAGKSMLASRADMIVANCLEWSAHYAYILEAKGSLEKVSRRELPEALMRRLG
jgi:phosphopantothenate-cysteine ligase/phosphopantothenoylcysteine decarboxylase/phosphopantothenate--cysteine ligase